MQKRTKLEDIKASVYNQLLSVGTQTPQEKFYKNIQKSFTGNETTYDDIKMAKKKLWEHTGKELGIPQTKLLEFIAKAMGYSGHHSMKKKLNERSKQTPLILRKTSAIEMIIKHSLRQLHNSPQMKFFQALSKSSWNEGILDAAK